MAFSKRVRRLLAANCHEYLDTVGALVVKEVGMGGAEDAQGNCRQPSSQQLA